MGLTRSRRWSRRYFQWSPTHNTNSQSHRVSAGDVLFGSVSFNPSNQSYTMYHSDMTTGWSVTTNIPVQKTTSGLYKNYTLTYFVMEKVGCCCCLDQSIELPRHTCTHYWMLPCGCIGVPLFHVSAERQRDLLRHQDRLEQHRADSQVDHELCRQRVQLSRTYPQLDHDPDHLGHTVVSLDSRRTMNE